MRRITKALVFCLVVGLSLAGLSLLVQAEERGEPFTIVFSTNEDYDTSAYATEEGLKEVEQDFQLVKELGLSRLRVSFSWSNYQPSPGQFANLDWLHDFVDLAAEYDITLMPYLCYGASWATEHGEWNDPPKDYQYWYDYVYRMVSEFKDKIDIWELWNEQDHHMWWTGTIEEFAKLLEVGAQAVRDANPDATVVMGGITSPNTGYVERLLELGASEHFDVLPVHSYHESWNSAAVESYITRWGSPFNAIADLLAEKGDSQPIWMNEIGYPTVDGKTEEDQASFIRRAVATLLATEDISLISWYEIKDLPIDFHLGVIGDSNNYHLGLTDTERNKKLGFYTFQNIVSLLNNETLTYLGSQVSFEHDVAGSQSPIIYTRAFRRESDNNIVLFAWLYGPHGEVEVDITLPDNIKSVVEYEYDGNELEVDFFDGNELQNVNLIRDKVRVFEIEVDTEAVGPLTRLHNTGEFFSPVLGLCEDYPRGSFAEDIEQDFALMAEYGITDMRISIGWNDYEFFKDFFDWQLLDDKVALANRYGIELYPYICYSPTWATGAAWRSPPMDMQDWYDFVYTVVDRYKDSISHWELWNEGDNWEFWVGSWEEQLELVRVGAQAVKDADPEAKTIFGGLTNLNPPHVETIFTSGVADYIDVINIHFYNETWNPNPTELVYERTKAVADVIRKHGGKQELWIAEIGYSDYVEADGRVSGSYRRRYPYEKTQDFQAVTFARTYARIAATEDVSNILWYEIKNLPLGTQAIGDLNNHYLGALDFDYYPKPLWFAITSFVQLFSEPFRVIDDQLQVVDEDRLNPFVHAFERENGDIVLLAWNRGVAEGTIEVSVPNLDGKLLSYTVTGNKEIIEGNSESLELWLDPEQVTIIEILNSERPRLALEDIEVDLTADGAARITATATNLGDKTLAATFNVWPSEGVEIAVANSPASIELSPEERHSLSWSVTVENGAEDARVWVIGKTESDAPAAELIRLP